MKGIFRLGAVGMLVAALITSAMWAASAGNVSHHVATATSARPDQRVLNSIALRQAIVLRPGEPAAGVLARVGAPGQYWSGTFGDTHTGQPIPDNAHFRIGSITKTFEATVVLQLVAEHRLDLDQTVQHYLPGLLPATYQPITVRQLLNMTSGLPDIDAGASPQSPDQTIRNRFVYRSFDQVIQETLRPLGRPWPGPLFAPGIKQAYNSLGYRIAGAIIERVTGHAYATEVTTRILRPLHLSNTFLPQRDPHMPTPYLHGYLTTGNGELVDVSEQRGYPSSMISTATDLDHFIVALFGGNLLGLTELAEMFTPPPAPYVDASECNTGPNEGQACFGAGLMSTTLPNGVVLWGKTGHDLGYASGVFATRDLQRHGVYSVATTTTDSSAPAVANRLATAAFTP
jgi:D-alanyl-D-alanine carboxypeptidase